MSRHQEQDIADDRGGEIQNEIACEVCSDRFSKRERRLHVALHGQKVANEVKHKEALDYEGEEPHEGAGLYLNAFIQ